MIVVLAIMFVAPALVAASNSPPGPDLLAFTTEVKADMLTHPESTRLSYKVLVITLATDYNNNYNMVVACASPGTYIYDGSFHLLATVSGDVKAVTTYSYIATEGLTICLREYIA